MSILEQALTRVAPGWAAARAKDRAQAAVMGRMVELVKSGQGGLSALAEGGGGAGEVNSVSRYWSPGLRDARGDQLPQLGMRRGQSRELASSNAIAAGAIRTNIERGVGTGLALVSQPNARVLGWSAQRVQEWKAHTQAEFSLWADSTACDWDDELNFYQKQAMTLEAALVSGDCFTLMPDAPRSRMRPYALRLQTLEADRVGNPLGQMDTPTVAGGVKLRSEGGGISAFYLYDRHPGGLLGSGKPYAGRWVDRVGASGRLRMLQHYQKRRPGQLRGMPYLAPVVECIKQIGRWTEGEIMAAVLSAYFTVFIETPGASPAPVFQGDQAASGAPGQEIGLGKGAVVGLGPGEKPHFANPGRPNPNFEPFFLAILKQIGMALGLPYELLLKQFNSSYSASKAALLDAAVYFKNLRYWLAMSFCQPIYETWLAEAVMLGRVDAPGFFADPLLRWAYTRAAWLGDSMGSINPKDEVQAFVSAVDARLMTRERAEWELFGTDWNESFDQKAAEQSRLRDAGMLPVPKAGAAAPVDEAPKEEETP